MDSKKLSAFLTVLHCGSLTAAAEQLNYTQSGMTHMMNALEKELGVTLLHRGRNGVALTDAAKQLLPQIEQLVAAAAALEAELAQYADAGRSVLRVGAYSSMAQHWLPEILHRYRAEFPSVDVLLEMGAIQEIYARLRSGELDCAFVSYQAGELSDALDWVPLRNDALVAVLPPDYPAEGALFSIRDFEGKDFLMPSNGFDLDILPMLRDNGVRPLIRNTTLDDPAIISMVEHGLGLSVLTALVMQGRQDAVLTLPLMPPAYRQLGLAVRREHRSLDSLRGFVAHSLAAIAELYGR